MKRLLKGNLRVNFRYFLLMYVSVHTFFERRRKVVIIGNAGGNMLMSELNINDGSYDIVSDVPYEAFAATANDSTPNDAAAGDGSNEPEFKVFDIAHEASEWAYRHRALRRSSSIL